MRIGTAAIVLATAWTFNTYATPVTTVDWGFHDPVEAAFMQPKGNVDDFIRFALRDATGVLSSAESKHTGAATERKGGTVYLFQELGDVLVGSYEFGAETPSTGHEFALQRGGYYYRIVSTGSGASGGAYDLTSSLSDEDGLVAAFVLTEPQGYALVLAGLAALGWSTRRRKT